MSGAPIKTVRRLTLLIDFDKKGNNHNYEKQKENEQQGGQPLGSFLIIVFHCNYLTPR